MKKHWIGMWVILSWMTVINAEPVLVINVTGDEPLNTANHKGFLDLVGMEVFRRIGREIEWVRLPAERALINLNAGLQDGEMSRISGLKKKYPNLLMVPETVMTWEFMAFSHRDIKNIRGWDSLQGYTVGIINGWKILEKKVPAGLELIKVKDATQLFNLLYKRRVDVVIYEKWAGLHRLAHENKSQFRVHASSLVTRPMYIYLNKKYASLVKPLKDALLKIKANGQYDRYKQKTLIPIMHE